MIKGHGDDIFSYDGIRHNFSSNIVIRTDLDALFEHLNRQMPRISSYPEPDAASLTRLWASSMHIQAENLCVTNGATEAIYLIAQVYRESVSTIFVPTFSEYADACRINRHTIREAYSVSNLNSQLSIFNFQLKDGLCWLCNPNNPTGKVFDHDWLTDLIESHPRCIFIIDQSYAPYTLKRVIDVEWAVQQPNVLLLHSMTKQFGVPGLRIGGVSGHPGLIRQLRLFLMPWSVNELAVEAGKFLLQNQWPQANVDCKMVNGKWSNGKWSNGKWSNGKWSNGKYINAAQLISERERVAAAFEATRLIDVWPSDSHMLLSRLRTGKAQALKDYLATERGILIRDASNFAGLDAGCFRIAVQSREANDLLIESIREWIFSI